MLRDNPLSEQREPDMRRRDLLRALASTAFLGAIPRLGPRVKAQGAISYQSFGSGPVLFLSPFRATPQSDVTSALRQAYLERLSDQYRVIVMDLPPAGSGGEAAKAATSFTPDWVCEAILAVADQAGAEHFAWYGYSWGGVVGLQLAARTDRLTALVCGGWAPLGAPYSDMHRISLQAEESVPDMLPFMSSFYRELVDWPERQMVSALTCPRMTFGGGEDTLGNVGALLAEHREELERLGWQVRLVDGARHDLFRSADIVVPIIRQFLDPLLLRV